MNRKSDVSLRAATADDIPALAELGRESFVAKFGHLYQPDDLNSFVEQVFSHTAITQELANPQRLYRLAEAGGHLAGYCKLALTCGWPEYARGRNTYELKQLYTASGLTGRGIGAHLMDWALDEARQRSADEMQLSVWSLNDGAQHFFARYGFTKVADVNFMVGEHTDLDFLFARML